MSALSQHGRIFYAIRGKTDDGEERWLRRVSSQSLKWSWGAKSGAEVFEDSGGYGEGPADGFAEAKRVARYLGKRKNRGGMNDIAVFRVQVALKIGQAWPIDPVASLAALAPVEM